MRTIIASLLVLGLVLATGCSRNNPVSGATGTVRFDMTDAPGPFDAVHLVVTEVAIHRGYDSGPGGWEVLRRDTTSYDLMQLRNGVFAALGEATVPAGHYTQVRLVLGSGCTVTVAGVPYPLVVPSGRESGYKIQGGFDVLPNQATAIGLDFEAARSIRRAADGTWLLNPVCRVVPIVGTGAIMGFVMPDTATVTIDAVQGAGTVATTTPGLYGAFTLPLLGVGSYDLVFRSGAFRDTTVAGIVVNAQQTTVIPLVELTPQ